MSTLQILIRTFTQISYLQSSALSTPIMLPPRALVRTRKLREQESRWLSFSGYKERKKDNLGSKSTTLKGRSRFSAHNRSSRWPRSNTATRRWALKAIWKEMADEFLLFQKLPRDCHIWIITKSNSFEFCFVLFCF